MLVLAYPIFLASGAAALLYQVVWQRLLVIFAGSDVHSATIVVSAFMAGLGVGAAAGGWMGDRLTRRQCLAGFMVAELAIALFGMASADIYYGVLYEELGARDLDAGARAGALFVSLLWPTFWMGASLPLLARAVTPSIGQAASVTGGLYGANTVGAALGAFATTWLLLPSRSLDDSLAIGAMLNAGAGLAVLPLWFTLRRPAPATETGADPGAPRRSGHAAGTRAPSIAAWALVYGLSGFIALSLEIVWFRLISVMQKSTSLTFGTLLAIYLAGLGIGAAIGARAVGRSRHPEHAFLALIGSAGLAAGLAFAVFMYALADPRTVPWLSAHLSGYEPVRLEAVRAAFDIPGASLPRNFVWLYFGIPALLIGPATLLLGASFPFVQRVVQTDLAHLGRRVGGLLVANIAGSALGSFVTGWVLLDWLGSAGTLRVLVAAGATFPLLALMLARTPPPRFWTGLAAGSAASGLALALLLPGSGVVWSRLHGAGSDRLVYGEDGSGLSALRVQADQGREIVGVFVNGLGQSWLPYGGVHTALGALPAFLHDDPRTAALIGLGSGDTVFGLAARASLGRIACIEIVRPQLGTLRELDAIWPYPGLRTLLGDPRVEHVYGDGRLHLLRSAERYDIIEADALRPTSAYAGHLYSDAYFRLLHDRLTPGGLAVTWAPTARVRDTMVSVFPHVLIVQDIAIGSNRPVPWNPDTLRRRISEPGVRAYFERAGIDVFALFAPLVGAQPRVFGPDVDRTTLTDLNTDLFPRDEFAVPRAGR